MTSLGDRAGGHGSARIDPLAADQGGWVTRVDRAWLLAPFLKQLQKRQREVALLEQLSDCLEQLYRDSCHPGLNLETIQSTVKQPVLSARIDKSHRLILTPLTRTQVGLLYFDNHDEAYEWVRRQGSRLGTMLAKQQEAVHGTRFELNTRAPPVVRAEEESPIALASAAQFRQMLDEGVARYLTYLDEEQRRLAELNVNGLLLVKGGAGTGKTAVAVHRLLNLVRQPVLIGSPRVLYLCYNGVLAGAVNQLINALCNGSRPRDLEARTFHAWCLDLLRGDGVVPPDDRHHQGCKQSVFATYARLPAEKRAVLGDLKGDFLLDEIVHVIKHNGLTLREQYSRFNRHGRPRLKDVQRDIVWDVYEASERARLERQIYDWDDLPLMALAHLNQMARPPQYRAVIVDEGQDCTPVMLRLARRLLADSNGPLTVFADPAQAIYQNGFHWTQQELKPSGGNVRWLRKSYRCTQEIYALARPLLNGHPELAEDLAKLDPPDRHGPRPVLVISADSAELVAEVAGRITTVVAGRPAHQVAVLGARRSLKEVHKELQDRNVRAEVVVGGALRLQDPAVKLLTQQSAKGLDFPVVFVLPLLPRRGASLEEISAKERKTLYVALTRASEQLTVGAVYEQHHPLLERLPTAAYKVEGSRAREFVGTRGTASIAL